jgi:Mn-dependent DtxR family transcriptional regulator
MSTLEEKVLQTMQNAQKPVKTGDVAKELDVESKEVTKAIKKLKEEGKVHSPKRCYYEPLT